MGLGYESYLNEALLDSSPFVGGGGGSGMFEMEGRGPFIGTRLERISLNEKVKAENGSWVSTEYILSFIIISPSALLQLQHLREMDDARCPPPFPLFLV